MSWKIFSPKHTITLDVRELAAQGAAVDRNGGAAAVRDKGLAAQPRQGSADRAPKAGHKGKQRKFNVGKWISKRAKKVSETVKRLLTPPHPLFGRAKLAKVPAEGQLAYRDAQSPSDAAEAKGRLETILDNFKGTATFLRGAEAKLAGTDFIKSHTRFDVAVSEAIQAAEPWLTELVDRLKGNEEVTMSPQYDLQYDGQVLLMETTRHMMDSLLPKAGDAPAEAGVAGHGLFGAIDDAARDYIGDAMKMCADDSRDGIAAEDRAQLPGIYLTSECFLRGVQPELFNLGVESGKNDTKLALIGVSKVMMNIIGGKETPIDYMGSPDLMAHYQEVFSEMRPRYEIFCSQMGRDEALAASA